MSAGLGIRKKEIFGDGMKLNECTLDGEQSRAEQSEAERR